MRLNLWMRGGILFFFIISTLIFFLRIFFGLDFTDSFFHINNAIYSEKFHPFFFLTSIIIRGVALCLGEELIIFRIVNAIFLCLSLILPFVISKRGFSWYDLPAISIGLIIMSPLNANILGYDTLTVLLISLCFSLIYRWDSFKTDKIILLTLLLAVGVFLRLPNVILILVLGFYVLVVENYKKSLMLIFLSLCFILIGYKILYSNSDLLKFSLGQKEHHNPMALLKNYFKDGLQVFGYILLIGSAYYLWLWLKEKRYAEEVMILILFPLLVFTISFSPYWIDFALFLTATGISWCIYRWFVHKEKWNSSILLFFLLLFVLPFGSNTGLLKASLGMVLFPFIYSIRSRNSKFWLLMIFVLIPIAVMEYVSMTYEDKAVIHLTNENRSGKLRAVRTSATRNDFLNNINRKVQHFKEEEYDIIFYGDKSHIFKYLYPESVTVDTWKFFQPADDLLEIEGALSKKSVLFFIDRYPDAFLSKDEYPLDSILDKFEITTHLEHNILYYTIEEPES